MKFRRPFADNVHPRTRGMHNFFLSDRALQLLASCRGGDKKRRAIKAVEVMVSRISRKPMIVGGRRGSRNIAIF